MRQALCVVMLFALLPPSLAAAEVYRWVDKNGVVHYADKPQAPDAKPAALPPLQTFKAGSTPALDPVGGDAASNANTAPADTSSLRINSPAAGETIRDAQGEFTVAVAAAPAPGQAFVYYLDGAPQNAAPTPSTALLFTGVERGTHTLSVARVDAGGHELGRSPPVTIFMKPPTAIKPPPLRHR